MQWLRRSFITGFFAIVPLVITVLALVWLFNAVDGLATPIYDRMLGRHIPGLGVLSTMIVLLIVGAFARNVIGRRIVSTGEQYLLRVPLFRSVYAPVRQLIAAFSPDNESGFKRVVLIEGADGGLVLGFLTKEFSVDRGRGPEPLVAVYVPTNHLYLGDIQIFERGRASFPDISVEEGIRIFLTGGMALPRRISSAAAPPAAGRRGM
ncbi:MAG: DUF502 domain-containing protein [Acidobacteria bacterium]|nr:DUF502 domain-containing protein [Acidobacteriota bacterium]